ncbi:hypothetical protein BDR22DRAFT_239236 [Usnea florida]
MVLEFCDSDLKELMQFYIESITFTPPPSTPKRHEDFADDAESDNDEIYQESSNMNSGGKSKDEPWHDAFRACIRRIIRQHRATSILASLKHSLKSQILKIDFNVAEEEVQPDNTMEHWEETIKELYKDKEQKQVCSEVLGALRTIAGGGAYELDKSYTPLKDDGMEDPPLKITSTKDSTLKRKAWKDNSTGSIHCGVIIAIHQPEGSNVSLSMILHFHNFIHILTHP